MSDNTQPKRLSRKVQLALSAVVILFALGASLFFNQENQASLQTPAGEEIRMTGTYNADITVKDYGTIPAEAQPVIESITIRE